MTSQTSRFAVLKNRSVLALLSARSFSLIGNAMAPVAIAFAVLRMPGGSATTLGLVLTARMAAQVFFVLFGGVLADRLPRNKVMVGADIAAGLTQTVVGILVVTGQPRRGRSPSWRSPTAPRRHCSSPRPGHSCPSW